MADQEKKIAQELFRKAYDFQMAGELEEAIEHYQQSIETFPTAEAYTFLGWAYSFQGRYKEAINQCKQAIEVDPDFGNPYNDIGAYLIELGKSDDAIPWLRKAITAKRYESYFYPHYNLGRVYEKKGNWDEAKLCYEQAVKMNKQYTLAVKALNRLRSLFN